MINGRKSRDAAERHLKTLMEKVTNPNDRRNIFSELYNKFNIDPAISSDMITFSRDIQEFTNFEIFAMMWFLDRDSLPKYFTSDEIESYKNEKIEEDKMELPITFDVIQISDNQWVGKTSLQQLMKLRDSQMINYRENAQRAYRIIKSGGTETFRIFINKKAVDQIRESMEKGNYIPDDITLNMLSGESRFSYKDGKLTVYELPNGKFDIIDGYHRFLGMSSIYNFDKNFDYPMEIRVTNFDIGVVQQMIYQKDQKTLMKKSVSETFNQYSLANRICNALNQDSGSLVQGMIGRNKEVIPMDVLSSAINKIYVASSEYSSGNENIAMVKIKTDIISKFNNLAEVYGELWNTEKKWNPRLVSIIIYVFNQDVEKAEYRNIIDYLMKYTEEESDVFKIVNNSLRAKAINLMSSGLKEWRKNHVVQSGKEGSVSPGKKRRGDNIK